MLTVTLVVGLVIALLPLTLSDYHLSTGAHVGVFFIAILSLNIVTGYTGQISIGQGAFMAFGGYYDGDPDPRPRLERPRDPAGSGARRLRRGASCWPACAAAAGRLPGLTTFAVALVVPHSRRTTPNFTGGTEGLSLPTHSGLWLYRTAWTIAGIMFVLSYLLLRGRTARPFRAVRDSEIAAASSGVALPIVKTMAFGISAAIPAVAGSIYVLVINFVNPDVFALTLSLYILIGAVVGGLGSLWGVIVGAAFVELLPIGLTSSHISSSQSVPVIFGAVVIAVMALLPARRRRPPPEVLKFGSRTSESVRRPQGTEAR